MSKLADSTCEACRIDAPMVADDDALILLKEIEDWHIIDTVSYTHLTLPTKA